MQIAIVGGSDAGISAALRAREVDANCQVTLVVADAFANFSICGLPYYVSGEVGDWQNLAHRTLPELTQAGLSFLFGHFAENIDSERRALRVRTPAGSRTDLPYDRLILATGANPVRPRIPGFDLPGVFPLHTMDHALSLNDYLDTRKCSEVLVVGGGYIGLEMADALRRRGLAVTLVELSATLLQSVDPSLGELVRAELRGQGVQALTGVTVQRI